MTWRQVDERIRIAWQVFERVLTTFPADRPTEPVADSELRDRIAKHLHAAQCIDLFTCPDSVCHWREWTGLADVVMAAVAPVLAAKDAETLEIARLLGTSVDEDGLTHEAIVRGIRFLRGQKVDCKRAAVMLGEQRDDLQSEIAKAHELLLALGADTDWPLPPPSLKDRIELVRLDLEAGRMNVEKLSDDLRRAEADLDGRVRALATALGTRPGDTPTGGFYRMCQTVAEMRAELEAFNAVDGRGRPMFGQISYGDDEFPRIAIDASDLGQPDNEDIELTAMLKDRSTEPRVWRKGDPEPPDSIQVLVDCKDDHLPYLCRIPGTEWWQWFDSPADRDRAPGGVPWDEATSVMGSSKKDYLVPLPGFSELDSPTGGIQ